MNEKLILGKKTPKQILNDVETRLVQKVISGMIWLTAIILAIILSGTEFREYVIFLILGFWVFAVILFYLGNRCPFCDSFKSYENYEIGRFFSIRKGSFRCDKCNFSSNQISENVDMLSRGVEVDKDTIAQVYRRKI